MAESSKPMLPPAWIDRIFLRLQGMYGSIWVDRWRTGVLSPDGYDLGTLNAKLTWAESLSGFADQPDRIHRALDACRELDMPPSLPEFVKLCRQGVADMPPRLEAPKVPRDVARQRAAAAAEAAEAIATKRGGDMRAWARDILANPKKYPSASVRLAQEAITAPE